MYCNCKEVAVLAKRRFRIDASVFYPTHTIRDGVCKYCGIYAVKHPELASAQDASYAPPSRNRRSTVSDFHRKKVIASKRATPKRETVYIRLTDIVTGEQQIITGIKNVLKTLKCGQKFIYKHANSGVPYKNYLIERFTDDNKRDVPS